MRVIYIAYPTSLMLKSANAIQTFHTLQELRRLAPDTLGIVPRWLQEPSRFTEVGALHLPRPAIGKLSRLYRTTLLYYAERSVYALMTALVVLWERLRGRGADIVYVREAICAGWWAAVFGPLLRVPVIYEAHDLESWNPSRAREQWVQPLLNLLDRAALTRSTAVTSLTDEFRQLLAQIGWRDPAEVAVIPDAFDAAQLTPGDRLAARQQIQIAPDAPLLVYAGMTFSYRSLDLLIDAFAQLRQTYPNARLALVGGRPQEIATLKTQATQLGIQDSVTFTGQIAQTSVLPFLQAADLLVIPDTVTDVTASPLKLFEYLAVGRAVVLPDIPALTEILPASIGYYFQRGDLADLTRVLHTALADPQRAARETAGLAAVAEHTYAKRAERILTLASTILQKRGSMGR